MNLAPALDGVTVVEFGSDAAGAPSARSWATPGGHVDSARRSDGQVAMSHVRARLTAYLHAHNTMTLATEHNGIPFACSLFYVNDELDLYFVSDTETRHALNIGDNPSVAVTISEDHRDWRTITGLQLEGTCEMLDAFHMARPLALYAMKFPFVGQLGAVMANVKCYKITPRWVRLVDNTRGFGSKEELALTKTSTDH